MATVDLRDVGQLLDNYDRRMTFIAKDATQRVVNDMQRERNQGGRMPVDSGYLRWSIAAAVGHLPSGEGLGSKNRRYPAGDITATLIRWQPATETIYVGHTAVYARAMEYRYGFLRLAVQKWPTFVKEAVEQAQKVIR